MTYLALARQYRPKSFETMVGQEAVVKALQNALNKAEREALLRTFIKTYPPRTGKGATKTMSGIQLLLQRFPELREQIFNQFAEALLESYQDVLEHLVVKRLIELFPAKRAQIFEQFGLKTIQLCAGNVFIISMLAGLFPEFHEQILNASTTFNFGSNHYEARQHLKHLAESFPDCHDILFDKIAKIYYALPYCNRSLKIQALQDLKECLPTQQRQIVDTFAVIYIQRPLDKPQADWQLDAKSTISMLADIFPQHHAVIVRTLAASADMASIRELLLEMFPAAGRHELMDTLANASGNHIARRVPTGLWGEVASFLSNEQQAHPSTTALSTSGGGGTSLAAATNSARLFTGTATTETTRRSTTTMDNDVTAEAFAAAPGGGAPKGC